MPELDNRYVPIQALESLKLTDTTSVGNSDDQAMPLEGRSETLELEQGGAKDAIIVLVLGTPGAGKSSFIDKATKNTGRGVGHDLDSGTKEVAFIECFSTDGSSVVLVDTPGFDGERRSPIAILGEVSTRLNERYGIGARPSVILHFQPITHSDIARRPLGVIEERWGRDAQSEVFFVTTMWDEIAHSEDGGKRLTKLKALLPGHTILKHLDTRDSAVQLLDRIVQWAKRQVQVEFQLQREIEGMDRAGIRDVIIALVGPTGTGKSSFIDTVTGGTGEGVGHNLTPCTSEIKVTRCAIDGFNVVLVDTPSFNDTNKSELKVLGMISDWVDNTYEPRRILAAILYFHCISENLMPAASPMKNLRLFQILCGKNAMSRVDLVTTMWDEVKDDVGEERLKELEETHWKPMISRGSTMFKHLNTQDSAVQSLRSIVERTIKQEEHQLQGEISGMKLELQETATGKELCSRLEELAGRRKEILQRIRTEGRRADRRTMRDLWKVFAQVKPRLESALTEARARIDNRIGGGSTKNFIIVLMGPTGSGKSSFIDKATKNIGVGVGHGLVSHTEDIRVTQELTTDGSSVVMVDTPGLDGERQSPVMILSKVSTRLSEKYGTGTKPSAILYFQSMLRSHVTGQPLKIIDLLQELWGKDAKSKVFFVTTMWDEIEDSEDGEERLTELKDRGAILRGYTSLKHLDTRDSAMQLLDQVVQRTREQEEEREIDRAGVRDVIIALVGPTGTGKSSFIDTATGGTGEGVGHSLTPCTSEIKASSCAIHGFNVILVDTPGFNDVNQSQPEVPEMISNWLDITYERRPIFSAVLYFHRISDKCIPVGTPMKIRRVSQKLCEKNAISRIALVTTMWDEEEADVGEEKLKELKDTQWKMMFSQGSATFKYLNTQDSATQLLRSVVERTIKQEELRLHQQILGIKLELRRTSAGQELCSRLEMLEKRVKEILRRILAEGERVDRRTMQDFWRELVQVKALLDSTVTQAQVLRETHIRNSKAWIRIIFAKTVGHRWVGRRRQGWK
ncbi:P-loop containing nucleoside triphosphate hydrolase protein [Pisolithus marmoratus]|nr:P-loop containing nucleoside triphosphate hydrolase protein [Pisolithus marmoratus]